MYVFVYVIRLFVFEASRTKKHMLICSNAFAPNQPPRFPPYAMFKAALLKNTMSIFHAAIKNMPFRLGRGVIQFSYTCIISCLVYSIIEIKLTEEGGEKLDFWLQLMHRTHRHTPSSSHIRAPLRTPCAEYH